ncbi:MAG: type II toxin-antitoxin system death-on-curing family toxin [Anaerolineae bacterium]|nr:type II toxin-antitoxin system death-on-curing family toxin [Anaerolineae bacterium]
MIRNHLFLDDNKRGAITAVGIFLQNNGYTLNLDENEIVRFTLTCAQSKVSLEEIQRWFNQNSLIK